METIKILLDTNIIEENTKDALAIEVSKEESIPDVYDKGSEIIKGTGMTITKKSYLNLGNLKFSLEEANSRIAFYTNQKSEIEAKIASVEPQVDKAISEAVANGATDNRSK